MLTHYLLKKYLKIYKSSKSKEQKDALIDSFVESRLNLIYCLDQLQPSILDLYRTTLKKLFTKFVVHPSHDNTKKISALVDQAEGEAFNFYEYEQSENFITLQKIKEHIEFQFHPIINIINFNRNVEDLEKLRKLIVKAKYHIDGQHNKAQILQSLQQNPQFESLKFEIASSLEEADLKFKQEQVAFEQIIIATNNFSDLTIENIRINMQNMLEALVIDRLDTTPNLKKIINVAAQKISMQYQNLFSLQAEYIKLNKYKQHIENNIRTAQSSIDTLQAGNKTSYLSNYIEKQQSKLQKTEYSINRHYESLEDIRQKAAKYIRAVNECAYPEYRGAVESMQIPGMINIMFQTFFDYAMMPVTFIQTKAQNISNTASKVKQNAERSAAAGAKYFGKAGGTIGGLVGAISAFSVEADTTNINSIYAEYWKNKYLSNISKAYDTDSLRTMFDQATVDHMENYFKNYLTDLDQQIMLAQAQNNLQKLGGLLSIHKEVYTNWRKIKGEVDGLDEEARQAIWDECLNKRIEMIEKESKYWHDTLMSIIPSLLEPDAKMLTHIPSSSLVMFADQSSSLTEVKVDNRKKNVDKIHQIKNRLTALQELKLFLQQEIGEQVKLPKFATHNPFVQKEDQFAFLPDKEHTRLCEEIMSLPLEIVMPKLYSHIYWLCDSNTYLANSNKIHNALNGDTILHSVLKRGDEKLLNSAILAIQTINHERGLWDRTRWWHLYHIVDYRTKNSNDQDCFDLALNYNNVTMLKEMIRLATYELPRDFVKIAYMQKVLALEGSRPPAVSDYAAGLGWFNETSKLNDNYIDLIVQQSDQLARLQNLQIASTSSTPIVGFEVVLDSVHGKDMTQVYDKIVNAGKASSNSDDEYHSLISCSEEDEDEEKEEKKRPNVS